VSVQRVRIRAMPLLPALVTGAWAGFVPGLFIGAIAGVLLSFGAGAALEWMRELSFTTGIQQQLLPFGDRIGVLETLQDDWPVVIPACALLVGVLSALIGALTAGLVSASYGSLLGGVEVDVEPVTVPAAGAAAEPAAGAAAVKPERRRRTRRRHSDSAA
jgi:hypothetical protein